MAKQIRIPYVNLPDINAETGQYQIRYRISSQDRNRLSAWSPIFSLSTPFTFETGFDPIVQKNTGYSLVIWDSTLVFNDDQLIEEVPYYDIWIRWSVEVGTNPWSYKERIKATSMNVIKPITIATIKFFSVEIYRPAQQTPFERIKMHDLRQDSDHVDLTNETITFPEVHTFSLGEEVRYESDSPIGGLTNNTNYYVGVISDTTIALYYTREDALSGIGRVKLTSHPNSNGYFFATGCKMCDYLLYGSYNNPL